MKEWMIYVITAAITLILGIICIVDNRIQLKREEEMYEQQAIEIVESALVNIHDVIYHGVYTNDEIKELPEGYELIGEIVESNSVLSGHLTSTALRAGIQIFMNPNDALNLYAKVPMSEYDNSQEDCYILFTVDTEE